MHYHRQNLSYDRLPLWRHGRAWWGRLGWEWSLLRRTSLLGASIGRRGASLRLPGFSIYVHDNHSENYSDGRFGLTWSDGCLRLEHPWIRQMEWRSDDPWYRKQVRLPLVDWLIGRARCEVTDGEPFAVVVPMPEGSYAATAQPKTYIWRRRWYWPLLRRDSVSLDIPGGIPFAGKGENGWDCGDDGLWGTSGDTTEKAIANAVESVLKSRRKYGHDSKGTGRAPVLAHSASEQGKE